eukprot:CAMPEP_0204058678 /NCGR_PEP_ID=MMETSP0360-20130528/136383_1 /ASSEMBLY_ACC=CAM_ASM_000342 /TAXON_ID=268821 /ORGANISM="Scrippsiella Hangoei, Strain SHTV-5" /LENGTH=79 /DNA_ID=CAMNT_0051006225 /DNA_START=187 /DNA_END=422 /DNA_ORIENTATION=+
MALTSTTGSMAPTSMPNASSQTPSLVRRTPSVLGMARSDRPSCTIGDGATLPPEMLKEMLKVPKVDPKGETNGAQNKGV